MVIRMGDSFLDFMKQTGVFIVCAQSFLHFSAGKSYERYVKLLIGIMVLVQFIMPIKAVLSAGQEQELWEAAERFQKELEDAAGEIAWDYEDDKEEVLLLEKEIKKKIETAAAGYGMDIKEVKVCDNPPRIEIAIQQQGGQIAVEKIKISSREEASDDKYAEIRREFASALNTDEEYIMIKGE